MTLILIFIYFLIPYALSEGWTINVYTGSERFAGTDSNIFIRLFNSKYGYTHEYELNQNNWIIGDKLFPLKNLFESGGHDRFRIFMKNIEVIQKIHVRRDTFSLFQSDWFLDRIVIERNRDSTKFTFKCNCWLRQEQPHMTISVFSESNSIDKNNPWQDYQMIIIVLIISIVFITCIASCIREYCRHRRQFLLVQTPQQSTIVNRDYLHLLEPSAPPLLNGTLNSREDIQHTLSRATVVIQPTDEPPAYKDLFPN